MEARDRFIMALAEFVNRAYYSHGEIFISLQDISAIAGSEKVPDNEVRAALRLLDDRGLLQVQDGGHFYSDGLGLALKHEEAHRRLFWERNKLRREILRLAAESYDAGDGELVYQEKKEQFMDAPWAETFAASRTLAYMGFLDVRAAMGHNFWASITSTGYELQRDKRELARELPTSAAEDGAASANVARDALHDLILSVEDLLAKRNWAGAARELQRGDDQYREGHWTDAVREYYAALESALKHRIDEADTEYSEGAALKDLARHSAANDLIPVNYQAMFGFVDSIRSPRSHGAGGQVKEVEVGQAEALLMANHVRALLLYLGHRPG